MAFAVDRDLARDGRASGRVTPVGAGSGSFSITPPDGGLRGGERIAIAVWARRAQPGGRVFAAVAWFDRAGRAIGRSASAQLSRVRPGAASAWPRARRGVPLPAHRARGAAGDRTCVVRRRHVRANVVTVYLRARGGSSRPAQATLDPVLADLWYKNARRLQPRRRDVPGRDGDGRRRLRRADAPARLPRGLGVDVIWLAPFQPSPNRDNGYDISDFYGVDPRYGSSRRLRRVHAPGEERGIRVIMDLVVNHTSDQHPWFQERAADPDARSTATGTSGRRSARRTGTRGWSSPATEGDLDARPQARQWYFHRFYEFQPDLNMQNPEVREEIRRIMGFWLELGVSGFRVDAVPFIIEEPPTGKGQRRCTSSISRSCAISSSGGAATPSCSARRTCRRRRCRRTSASGDGHAHDVQLLGQPAPLLRARQRRRAAAREGSARHARSCRRPASGRTSCAITTSSTSGRLTEEQRATVFARFGAGREMQLYGRGIRRRLAPMLGERPLARARVQPPVLAPRYPVLLLRRRDRHGRRPAR